ncbi:unnamed protein product [Protopolystoma xenopodis]|uniref:Major facilitator superfamily (MFS) profile domain-containing protein n=1 Tax=Protopolystoma xenopodis TaxID=117903 RepID=A0A448WAR6_9PLAT|nr:unnamed protein product [Protopolystoma xenopodis]
MEDGEFVWDSQTRGLILGVFFWGYLVSQIPSSLLAARIGVKRLVHVSMGLLAVSTLLVPFAARTSVILLCALRVVSVGQVLFLLLFRSAVARGVHNVLFGAIFR